MSHAKGEIVTVCGVNWGDEGKGRMVDAFAHASDLVVRYQGGNNAGHTVVNEHGTFKLHLVPSGIFSRRATNVLGPGTVVDLEALRRELDGLEAQGIAVDPTRLVVSERATICFPFHRDEDAWEEERLGQAAYGSTRRGIAPAYGDRYLKKAIQVGELRDESRLRSRLASVCDWKTLVARGVYGKTEAVALDHVLGWALEHGRALLPRITDTTTLLAEADRQGQSMLFEAQLGALRDVVHGIYPMTTSSSTLASYAAVGAGFFSRPADRVVGVMKAFSSCVGAGPFVTEMSPEDASVLREFAGEYGAATGRPRRVGHFDAVASRYGALIQGTTELALTKLDSLVGRDTLRICVAYEVDGRRLTQFPLNAALDAAQPIYESMDGFHGDVQDVSRFEALPRAAQAYVLRIEALVGCRIRWVSVGPERHRLIDRGEAPRR